MQLLPLIFVVAGLLAAPLMPSPVAADSACLAGTASATGRGPCDICPAGTSQPRVGETECVECRAGTFAAAEGQRTCRPCPEGTRQLRRGATHCDPVPELCSPGTFSTTGRAPCTPCRAGQVQARPGSRHCYDCPAGTVIAAGRRDLCEPATSETAQVASPAVAPVAVEVQPAAATAESTSEQRAVLVTSGACAPGTYSLMGTAPCLPCPSDAPCEQAGTSLEMMRLGRAARSAF